MGFILEGFMKHVLGGLLLMAMLPFAFATTSTPSNPKVPATTAAPASTATPPKPNIGAQKATILMRLTTWVDWPAEIESAKQFTICLVGNFDILKELNMINGHVVEKRELVVKPLSGYQEAENSCQMVYISRTEAPKASKIIQDLAKFPILLVSDFDDFAKTGGSMNFTMINNRLGVTINLESMQKAKLSLSPNAYRRITIVPEQKELDK